jgi:hypothetical protein
MNVLPSAELAAWRRQWPIVPSFTYGGMSYGTIGPARLTHRNSAIRLGLV